MTLQASGPISIQDISTEFGLSLPVSMSQLYGLASGVPTSGNISLTDFYGKSASTLDHTIENWLQGGSHGVGGVQSCVVGNINTVVTINATINCAAEDAFTLEKNNTIIYSGSDYDDTFTVVNGDTINFTWGGTAGSELLLSMIATFTNVSDGNVVLSSHSGISINGSL